MKKLSIFLFLRLVTLMIVTSCQTHDVIEPADNIVIEFKGEKVLIPANFPRTFFNQSQEDFKVYYAQLSGEKNARVAKNETTLTHEELYSILQPEVSKYPRLTYQEKVSDQDVKRILKDFPSITTYEEIEQKIEIIFEYYETIMRYDVAPKVAAFEKAKKAKSGRLNGLSPGSMTDPERDVLAWRPLGLSTSYLAAAQIATSNTEDRFGAVQANRDESKANAFKHSTWNALAIRLCLLNAPVSESSAINFVRDGTSAHEMENDGSQKRDESAAMDLNNNMAARKWMQDETKWGFGVFRKMPSTERIINTMEARANSATKTDLNGILNMNGGVSDNTWNRLYNEGVSDNQQLVYTLD